MSAGSMDRRVAERRKGPIRTGERRQASQAAPKGVSRSGEDRREQDRRTGQERRQSDPGVGQA